MGRYDEFKWSAQADLAVLYDRHNAALDKISEDMAKLDPSWKGVKGTKALVPLTGNAIDDTVVILDDGDTKGAIYTCIATTGTFEEQWAKVGDAGFSSINWNDITGKPMEPIVAVMVFKGA